MLQYGNLHIVIITRAHRKNDSFIFSGSNSDATAFNIYLVIYLPFHSYIEYIQMSSSIIYVYTFLLFIVKPGRVGELIIVNPCLGCP